MEQVKLQKMKDLRSKGWSYVKIAKKVGCGRTTVSNWLRKAGLDQKIRIDTVSDEELEKTIRKCKSISEVLRTLQKPISSGSYDWFHRRNAALKACTKHFKGKAHGTSQSPKKVPYEILLVNNSTYRISVHRKAALIRDGYLKNCCQICDLLPEWQGKPLNLRLDHINGDGYDHRIENLRLICPNCDSQLPTFCGRNIRYQS